jgi:hypothetical protein
MVPSNIGRELDRCFKLSNLYFKLHRHLGNGTVKSVWIRQVLLYHENLVDYEVNILEESWIGVLNCPICI